MESLIVPRSREDTLTVVKAALEHVDQISTYHVAGETMTAKTGHLPLKFRFGSVITITIPEDQQTDAETRVIVTEEVDAGRELFSRDNYNPELGVVGAIEGFDEVPVHKIEQDLQRKHSGSRSKEVARPRDQAGGLVKAGLQLGVYLLVWFILVALLFALVI